MLCMPKYQVFSGALICLLLSAPVSIAQGPVDPESRAAWQKANGPYDAANNLAKGKKYKEAIAKYREAIAIYPSSAPYHYNLALALKHSGNSAEAIPEFRKAIEINGKDWKSWKALGNSQYKLGKFSDAGTSFETAALYAPAKEIAELKSGITACRARSSP